MATNKTADPSRTSQFRVFAVEGAAGVVAITAASILRGSQVPQIFRALGNDAVPVVIVCVLFALATALLKFELTNRLFVSMVIISYIVIFPLLGTVMSAWIVVVVSVVSRGRLIRDALWSGVSAARFELANTLRLFATYGIPILAASLCYEALGGEVPLRTVTAGSVYRIIASALLLILTNALLMIPVMIAYGYGKATRARLIYSDSSIYLLALPYALMMTFSYVRIGLGAFMSLGFTGILINYVARKLASARSETRQQLQRVASLSNIGKTISLNFTTEQLLMTIYTECKKVVDVSLFSIALLDEGSNELSFEVDIQNDKRAPKSRLPLGEGLNSWVVQNHEPLLIGGIRDERRLGIVAVDDGLITESWLGVPMVARDRVIGVISVQSSRRDVFTTDDMLLLTAIANQAAVALENANLYKDLEGLTLALESRVQERTNELRETNLRLMAADRSKNQFLANMSHELRTPLNSIIGFSSVLIENARELIPGKPYKFLQNIYSAGTHLLELINDILDLSKIEAGKMELRPELFDIHDTVASIERVMRGYAGDSNM
ncbi:MAG TPA: histidine kinase dimerization/phospho-acceptor domain-containing protein, partial [Thermoanaerobaculia bacterium]|nr:histidine kinase dimerization/phospho-acceptor domain-containing protein [Thermoanaerobaculia bacterium]